MRSPWHQNDNTNVNSKISKELLGSIEDGFKVTGRLSGGHLGSRIRVDSDLAYVE